MGVEKRRLSSDPPVLEATWSCADSCYGSLTQLVRKVVRDLYLEQIHPTARAIQWLAKRRASCNMDREDVRKACSGLRFAKFARGDFEVQLAAPPEHFRGFLDGYNGWR